MSFFRGLGFASFILFFTCLSFAHKPVIVESHKIALKITELEKLPPPYAAYMWALANEAGYQSLKLKEVAKDYPVLAYKAAFTKMLALVKPNQASLALAWNDPKEFNEKENKTNRTCVRYRDKDFL